MIYLFTTFKVKSKGQNEGEKLLVPKLRFKEFKDEYNTYKLNDIVDFYKGNTLSKSDIKENGKFPCILYGELYTQYDEITDKVISYTDRSDKNLFHSKINDVLIPCSGETALDISTSTCILQDHVILGGDLNILRPKFQNGKYLSYLLSNKKRIVIARYAQGDSIVHLYGEKIKNINIDLPTIEEQEKVSKLLEFLSKKIELQQRKIEALKIYKTGVCQKLFQSIKADKTTFKMQISKFLKERKIYSEKGLEYPHVTLSKDGILDKSDRYNRDFLVMSNNKKYKITLLNDLCYNPANLKFGVICINEYGSAIFSPIYVTLEINPNIMDVSFCKYYFTRIDFINKVRKYEQGTVYERMSVNVEDFLKHTDVFPCLENQRKIAKILSNLDRKINLQKNTLNNLNILKKSLLQQMFI